MKTIVTFVVLFLSCVSLAAQRTFSFKMQSSYCPQTGQYNNQLAVAVLSVYDDYIVFNNCKYVKSQRNMDGSTTYLPVGNSGLDFYQVNAILVSSNLNVVEEHVTSTVGYMSLNMINTYGVVAEDDGDYAMRYSQAYQDSRRGGGSGSNNRSSTCSKCNGTGVDPTYLQYWGGVTSFLGHYNSNGNKCPYCGKYSQHYHSKCTRCNVPKY